MPFVLYCLDKPGAAQVRLDNRAAHLDYAKSWGDAVSLGGPLLAEDGESMIGSMLILDVDNPEEVERFVADDPYGRAGLFQSVTVHGYRFSMKNL